MSNRFSFERYPVKESRHFKPVGGDWSQHWRLVDYLTYIHRKHAADYHDAIEEALNDHYWTVRREFAVVIGDGYGGKVDIVADKDGQRIALELDNRSPRGKSLLKLATFSRSVPTAVLLRNPK